MGALKVGTILCSICTNHSATKATLKLQPPTQQPNHLKGVASEKGWNMH